MSEGWYPTEQAGLGCQTLECLRGRTPPREPLHPTLYLFLSTVDFAVFILCPVVSASEFLLMRCFTRALTVLGYLG